MFTPYFEVCDSDGISAVRILGSCCNTRCLSEQELQVVSTIGDSVGRIWKRWPGYSEECNMDHEYFGLDGKINTHNHIVWCTCENVFYFTFLFLFFTLQKIFHHTFLYFIALCFCIHYHSNVWS
ncbi:phospholipid scramblase 2-like [Pimephales promelas]|nr:phospholipid scramblase 2-like [Pimephales promelas]